MMFLQTRLSQVMHDEADISYRLTSCVFVALCANLELFENGYIFM